MKKIAVIGGGAAGMMAAYKASLDGAFVTIFEKNEKLGKKMYITGKGRCNVTNACDDEDFFKNIISNSKFMFSAYYGFNNQSVMEFFEEEGCRLKIERGNRVFPQSDHSSDIIYALSKALKRNKVNIRLNSKVAKIEDKRVILEDGFSDEFDAIIIATGGISYVSTGSDGDGYRFAADLGHSIVSPHGGLVPLVTEGNIASTLQGLSLKNVKATLKTADTKSKVIYSDFGEMLFTHFGVSGPLILSASSYYAKKYKNTKAVLSIDLKPALDEKTLDERVLKDFSEYNNKCFKNSLDKLLPAKLIPVIVELSGIDSDKKVNLISREERLNLVKLLKNFELTVVGTSNDNEAIITQGGVNVKEINPSTMESKIYPGIYFAGEVIDVDALTGGFNLQIAWSSGYLAGESAANS